MTPDSGVRAPRRAACLRILYLSTTPTHSRAVASGIGRHVAGMIDAFTHAGHEVEVALGGDLLRAGAPAAVRAAPAATSASSAKALLRRAVPALAWETLKDLRLLRQHGPIARRAEEIAERFRPRFIYERHGYLQVAGTRISARTGVPLVLEVNAPLDAERVLFSGRSLLLPVARKREHAALAQATLIVTVSTALGKHLQEQGVPGERILALPNAVEHVDVAPRVPSGPVTVGLVASFLAWHGLDLLVDAMARVRRAVPDARLLLVGSGPSLAAGLERARALGIADAVESVPAVPPERVHEQLARMDIGVMPDSNWYGSPMKIFEYGLHGIPVVSVDVGPVSEVVEHGRHGLLFPRGDLDAFASHLTALARDAEMRRRMGLAWRDKVLREHSWSRNVERLMAKLAEKGV